METEPKAAAVEVKVTFKMPVRPPRIRGEAGLLTSMGNADLHVHASIDGFCQTTQATRE